MATVFPDVQAFIDAQGSHLGRSSWHTVTQDQIDAFAEVTGDHQWIHVDPVRAADGPYGTTIAHGMLTLSLVPMLVWQIYTVDNLSMGVNYGSNRLRYPSPVRSGDRIRASATLRTVDPRPPGYQVLVDVVVEIEGSTVPACVVEALSLIVP